MLTWCVSLAQGLQERVLFTATYFTVLHHTWRALRFAGIGQIEDENEAGIAHLIVLILI